MRLKGLMVEAGLSQAELASALGQVRSSICKKVAGVRPWSLIEAQIACGMLADRLDREVTVDEVFGPPVNSAAVDRMSSCGDAR